MSTGKRLAKRSIIGTRVCSRFPNGIYYSGVIQAVKTPSEGNRIVKETNKYSVRFDNVDECSVRVVKELTDSDLIGPGFRTVSGCVFQKGQRVYLTYNGREVSGHVESHCPDKDEVVVEILPARFESKVMLRKRLEEVRLLESRKSARLMDQDTDFARLADMAGDRKRTSSHSIDVPSIQGSRKRRPSSTYDEVDLMMSENMAAMVLVRLSGSPHSPNISAWGDHISPSPGSDIYSWTSGGRSPTPSPPLSEGGSSSSYWTYNTDEGIVLDDSFDDLPKKKRTASRLLFRCTWKGCNHTTTSRREIESHIRLQHLGPKDDDYLSDHEEEFYYTEVEEPLPPAVHPHKDMCRPPHEDPEFQRTRAGTAAATASSSSSSSSSASSASASAFACVSASPSANTPWCSNMTTQKLAKLTNAFSHDWATTTLSTSAPTTSSPRLSSQSTSSIPYTAGKGGGPGSPTRKPRGDTKKCRKVYGMEHRELWCTQCKWKKACTRFGD